MSKAAIRLVAPVALLAIAIAAIAFVAWQRRLLALWVDQFVAAAPDRAREAAGLRELPLVLRRCGDSRHGCGLRQRQRLVRRHAGQGRDDAVTHYTQAAQLKSDDAKIPYNLGVTVAQQGKLDEAINYLTKALQIDPRNIPALLNLATSYDRIGQRDKAISSLQKALDLARSAGNDPLAQQITTKLNLYK